MFRGSRAASFDLLRAVQCDTQRWVLRPLALHSWNASHRASGTTAAFSFMCPDRCFMQISGECSMMHSLPSFPLPSCYRRMLVGAARGARSSSDWDGQWDNAATQTAAQEEHRFDRR